MATETAPPAERPRRPRLFSRARLPDLLIAAFLAMLALAIVINGIAEVHDTRRIRVDKKVAKKWFDAHPELGSFGLPVIKVHKREDIACAPRKPPPGVKTPVDGYCIWIMDSSLKSTAVLKSHRCMFVRPGVVRPKGMPSCPRLHGPQ
jgi:hypothetical protein